MIACLRLLTCFLISVLKSRRRLEAEVVVLRHQVNVLRRAAPSKLRLLPIDRLILVWLYRLFPSAIDAVAVVRPATVSAAMTAQFVTDALIMAIWRRGKPDALLHHSDRGSQYTSDQFQRLVADHGVTCSMSRSGNVWDNAAMESFFSSLKTERSARKVYRTRDEAKADVFDYIERFYNPKRRHSTIGYMSLVEFEMKAGLA